MNNSEIKQLQKIIMGHDYDEAIINKAIAIADIVDQDAAAIHLANRSTLLEVIICLRALRAGRDSFDSRMLLQDYVCRLQRGKANAEKEIKRLDQIKRHKRLAPLTQSQKQTIYDHERKHELIFRNGGLHTRPSKLGLHNLSYNEAPINTKLSGEQE